MLLHIELACLEVLNTFNFIREKTFESKVNYPIDSFIISAYSSLKAEKVKGNEKSTLNISKIFILYTISYSFELVTILSILNHNNISTLHNC